MGTSAWSELTRSLAAVASGRAPADIVIRNGRWVCVQTGEVLPGTDVAFWGERIAFVGQDATHTIGPRTRVVDAADRYLVPGLLDGHMHVESGMLTISQFVRAVLPHGTTGMFIDPHEIANVLGLDGVRLMVEEAAVQPVHVWVQVPSCVPPAPGLETPGASIGPAEVQEALAWPGVIGLGEVMNFVGVAGGDQQMHDEMAEARRAHKVIGGHFASPDLGPAFHAYVAGGPQDDHEGTRIEDAIARARQGMKVMLRHGSAWHDVAAQVAAVTEHGLDPRHFLLVTDDCHSGTLVHEGHVDRVVREAIRCGLAPMTAIQMATINTAEHFGVADDVGQIAPGRYADVLVTADLTTLKPELVFARGALAVEQGRLLVGVPSFSFPARARGSVRLPRPLSADDFELPAEGPGPVQANVIGVIENQAPTRHIRLTLPVQAGQVRADAGLDLAKAALVERHHGSGRIQVGLVQGFGLRGRCAFASTVSHDTHHLIVVGTDESCMARAANELARVGGGQVVVREDEILALLELPVAGLMSDAPAEAVAAKAQAILAALRACGCQLNNGNMQLSLLTLVVIPELRLSDLGLVDVGRFTLIPVLEPAG